MISMTMIICASLICLAILFIGFHLSRKFISFLYHCNVVNKHENYVKLLENTLERSYETVYKAQVVAYSAAAIKPEKDQLETIKRNYIQLSFVLMGPIVEKALTEYYGDRETLITAMVMYMEIKFDNDVIHDFVQRKQAADQGETPATQPTKNIMPEGMKII